MSNGIYGWMRVVTTFIQLEKGIFITSIHLPFIWQQQRNNVSLKPDAGFLVTILDVGTIFESEFSACQSPKYVILTSGIWFFRPNYSRQLVKYTFTLGSRPGHDLGTIFETIKKSASGFYWVKLHFVVLNIKYSNWLSACKKKQFSFDHWIHARLSLIIASVGDLLPMLIKCCCRPPFREQVRLLRTVKAVGYNLTAAQSQSLGCFVSHRSQFWLDIARRLNLKQY